MSALIISVGTTTRSLPHPTLLGVEVDYDVPDLRLPLRIGYVDPPLGGTHLHIAYFRGGGSMVLTEIKPGLWWAVASNTADPDAALAHLGASARPLHAALLADTTLADTLAGHRSGQWREELAIEGDDTSAVVGIRGPGVAGRRARDVALSGQDLGTDERPKAPVRIHSRPARRLAKVVAMEIS